MAQVITIEEWLAEIDRLGAGSHGDENAITIDELKQMTGRSYGYLRNRIKVAIKHGLMVATKRQSTSIDGRIMMVPAYRMVRKQMVAYQG